MPVNKHNHDLLLFFSLIAVSGLRFNDDSVLKLPSVGLFQMLVFGLDSTRNFLKFLLSVGSEQFSLLHHIKYML